MCRRFSGPTRERDSGQMDRHAQNPQRSRQLHQIPETTQLAVAYAGVYGRTVGIRD